MRLRSSLDRVRRRVEERADQAWALAMRRVRPPVPQPPFDGEPRLAVLTVNYSTTRYLRLLLATLGEQSVLGALRRVVVVDNGSRDGGPAFLRALAGRVPRVTLVENHVFLSHARGMRRGLEHLERIEADLAPRERTNLVLFVDTDVIFRRPDALASAIDALVAEGAAAAGELRRGVYPYPEAQASFLLVRRDALARSDVQPWVNHGAPAYWLQRSLWRAGLTIADFPANAGGHVLHRGRSGVDAARTHRPYASYASVSVAAHYMGVPDGARIWSEVETRLRPWLEDDARLVDRLAERFAVAAAPSTPVA